MIMKFINMIKIILMLATIAMPGLVPVMACTVCKSQQPAPLRDITHGAGPSGMLDFFIISGSLLIVLAVLILSIWYLARPGERDPKHIKNLILKGES